MVSNAASAPSRIAKAAADMTEGVAAISTPPEQPGMPGRQHGGEHNENHQRHAGRHPHQQGKRECGAPHHARQRRRLDAQERDQHRGGRERQQQRARRLGKRGQRDAHHGPGGDQQVAAAADRRCHAHPRMEFGSAVTMAGNSVISTVNSIRMRQKGSA